MGVGCGRWRWPPGQGSGSPTPGVCPKVARRVACCFKSGCFLNCVFEWVERVGLLDAFWRGLLRLCYMRRSHKSTLLPCFLSLVGSD